MRILTVQHHLAENVLRTHGMAKGLRPLALVRTHGVGTHVFQAIPSDQEVFATPLGVGIQDPGTNGPFGWHQLDVECLAVAHHN